MPRKNKRPKPPVCLVAKEHSQKMGRAHALCVPQVPGAILLEQPSLQPVRNALSELPATVKSVRPRIVANPAMLVISALATISVSNAHPARTAVRKVQSCASFAPLELSGHLLVLHRLINACPVRVEPALSIRNHDLKINVKHFVPKDIGQLPALFLVRHAHTTITKIPSEAHQRIPASDAPVRHGLVLVPWQSPIASPMSIHQIQHIVRPDSIRLQEVHPAILAKQVHTKMMLAVHLA